MKIKLYHQKSLFKYEFKTYYRIRFSKVRILFELINNEITIITIINDIDFRGGVYK